MERTLTECYLPPDEGFVLESLIATTYQIDFEFVEEDLLAAAFGVRSPVSRLKAFRSELERKLQKAEVSVLYDLVGCERLARLSPRIDAIPVSSRKLHSKISLLMWARENRVDGAKPDRRMRLIVGSANLTRHGFRHNYECVACVDYGGKISATRAPLTRAIELIHQISSGKTIGQLSRQLAAFDAQVALLPDGTDDSVALVDATGIVRKIRDYWTAISNKAPEKVTVVSPFWVEGSTAPEALAQLFQQLGAPGSLEIVCRGEWSADGKCRLPVFDSGLATSLKKLIDSRLYLRAALPGIPDAGSAVVDLGDESEDEELAGRVAAASASGAEGQRSLHAKMIVVDGVAGSVLYAGSSNCTRRGLGLGGPSNFEAGFVYRLTPRQREQISGLLGFAGPAIEVHSGSAPSTVQPVSEETETFVPSFLSEIAATGSVVAVRFQNTVPADLVLVMPIPAITGDGGYWHLNRQDSNVQPLTQDFTVDLTTCQRCDEQLRPLPADPSLRHSLPNVFVEVRWESHSVNFPVRFDDKGRLPFILAGRKPSEGELIEYFLSGREPDDWEDGSGLPGWHANGSPTEAPIDTRRILSYFIHRFIQAIPGIEAEIQRAGYARAPLDAALRGPTSPLALAERAYGSLTTTPTFDEPEKTPTAVGFQLTEILAALIRCQSLVTDIELKSCYDPVIAACREMLAALISRQAELRTKGFRHYRRQIVGDAR